MPVMEPVDDGLPGWTEATSVGSRATRNIMSAATVMALANTISRENWRTRGLFQSWVERSIMERMCEGVVPAEQVAVCRATVAHRRV